MHSLKLFLILNIHGFPFVSAHYKLLLKNILFIIRPKRFHLVMYFCGMIKRVNLIKIVWWVNLKC